MKPRQMPSGSYRVEKMYKGKRFSVYFDHKPTQREMLEAFSDITTASPNSAIKGTFKQYADKYMEIKKNVLSVSTLRTYNMALRNFPEPFMNLQLKEITREDIQSMINEYALTHSPKTVKNASGMVSAVMAVYRPDFAFKVTLPQVKKEEAYIPTSEEVKAVLEAAKGRPYEIALHLAAMGLRRSEICGLSIDDLDGRVLHIHSAVVANLENEYVKKDTTKNYTSTRDIVLPEYLVEMIHEQGTIYDGTPPHIKRGLVRCQKYAGTPEFTLHALRHFFISELFDAGVPEADIIHLVGHSTDATTKRVYRHTRIAQDLQAKAAATDLIASKIK